MGNNFLSANEAWLKLIENVLECGVPERPRDKLTVELIGHTSRLDMSRPIVTVKNRKLGYKFLVAEAWWILSGSNRVDEIAPYSKAISNFSDDGLTFRGAYGPKLMDQLPWVAEQLKNDPNTRQAVLTIWRERPGPSKDYPCTLAYQWLLRRNAFDGRLYLHCNVTMRSSDAWLGWVYDVFNGSMESAFLIAYLRTAYPNVFSETIYLGQLTLTAGSQHLYEEHWEQAKNCIFEPEPKFSYVPLSSELYQRNPYDFLKHLKAVADRSLPSPYFQFTEGDAAGRGYPDGAFKELYGVGGDETKTGFDAQPNPRGIKK